MRRIPAPAKINLALVVGPPRPDGKHEVATVLQRIDLGDRVQLAPSAGALEVEGFAHDTLVRRALELLAEEAGVEPSWRATITKRIPVASGLGGGSSDAAAALRLGNETLAQPLPGDRLHALAARLGADVPFFLRPGPQLATGDGTDLQQLDLPQDFFVVIVLPHDAVKPSTASVYEEYDRSARAEGFADRRAALTEALAGVRRPRDLAALPRNDLASSPLAAELEALGAFRADVSGAGPAIYGLFHHRARAQAARRRLLALGRVWTTVPAWYG
jgi:4-diphosphocytidyl-2-C-methyl-D-erythritol kinase